MYDHFTLCRLVAKTFTFKLILFELKNRALIVKKGTEERIRDKLERNGETAVSFGTEMTDRGANVNVSNARKIIRRFRHGRRSFPFVTPEIPARFHPTHLGGNRVLEQQLPTDLFFRPTN